MNFDLPSLGGCTMAQPLVPRQSCTTSVSAPILVAALAALVFFMPTQAFAETLQHRIDRLTPHFTISRPDAEGRVPVVLMMHGCGGQRPFMDGMAEIAVEAGAAAVQIDSFAPRRISRAAAIASVCTGARLHGRERAGDLYAAVAWAQAQDWADPNRIIAMGWSHGGWTIMDALALRSGEEMSRATGLTGLRDEPLEGLAGALIVYPYAGVGTYAGRRDWRLEPRSIAIVAERDYIVGSTRATLERQRARGTPLDIHVFENATHAFEDQSAEDPRVRYNPAATAREHAMLRELIEAASAPPQQAR
jgi:dienelactone hydrolase